MVPIEPFRPRRRLPDVPVRWAEEFPNEVESEETRQVSNRKGDVCIPSNGFLQTKNDKVPFKHVTIVKREHEQ